jgi:DNA-directed RNA polymerase specialized sigma24 family protein
MRRNPWTEEPTEADDLDIGAPMIASPERQTHARRLLERLLDCLRERLSPRGLHMFKRLYAEQVAPEELAEQEGLGRDAIYQWRSRIKQAVAKCRDAHEPAAAAAGGAS